MPKREYGTGSVSQRHDLPTCPPVNPKTRKRPAHKCKSRWMGQLNVAPPGAKRKLKTVYGDSKAEVVRKLGEARTAMERGDRSTSSPRFEAWLELWLDRAELRPRTRASYRSIINAYLVPALGNVRINAMNAEHVHRLHESMGDLSPTTIRNAHRCASAALTVAQKEQRITNNPFKVIPAPAKADVEQEWMTVEEADRLLAVAANEPNRGRWQSAIRLGLRPGENRGLTWKHVDLEAGVLDNAWQLQRVGYIHGCGDTCGKKQGRSCPLRKPDLTKGHRYDHVEGGLYLMRPKTDKGIRVIAIPADVLDILRDEYATYQIMRQADGYHDHGLVWHRGNGRPLSPESDGREWKRLLTLADVPLMRLYSARHTAATRLMEKGVDTKVIGKILGHSDVLTTQGYQHVDLSAQRRALES